MKGGEKKWLSAGIKDGVSDAAAVGIVDVDSLADAIAADGAAGDFLGVLATECSTC